jgi:hypothetical protein
MFVSGSITLPKYGSSDKMSVREHMSDNLSWKLRLDPWPHGAVVSADAYNSEISESSSATVGALRTSPFGDRKKNLEGGKILICEAWI